MNSRANEVPLESANAGLKESLDGWKKTQEVAVDSELILGRLLPSAATISVQTRPKR